MVAYHNLYLALAVVLFIIGAIGAITRRNAIIIFMCIEIMLGGVNLAFITFSRANQSVEGIFMVLFVMAVAAAEAAVGLAIFVLMYRRSGSINVESCNLMKW
ncbi:MAG: NADH-quinone oxidoreductase subunit NuoK [Deltaproteobacteria bacterium]|nr:NADH-quinone oxidoreductase subunit NuoK [Candidatus Anaeroferrophillus wilburensis]MBN2889220.1 NADH-quinone oxidoreductase subunit NuoK [Deltaproteobacteria bacterium]